jgi:hypothetical protein
VGTVSAATGGGFQVDASHAFVTPGTFTAKVTITDANPAGDVAGSKATATAKATVAPLTITAQGVDISAVQDTAFSNTVVADFSASAGAQASDFRATISWGDGTMTDGTVTAVSGGGFQVAGSHTFKSGGSFTITTAITAVSTANGPSPDTATAMSTATVQAVSPNERFVDQAFLELLGRAATTADRQTFGAELNKGTSRVGLALQLQHSNEGLIHTVQSLYSQFLNRGADAGGLTDSVELLLSGGTVETLSRILLSSDEYFNDATKGGGTNSGFLAALYKDILGRAIESNAQTLFGQDLSSGTTRDTLVREVLECDEPTAIRAQRLYQQFDNRTPTANEVNNVATGLRQGATDALFIAGIIGSNEVFNQM